MRTVKKCTEGYQARLPYFSLPGNKANECIHTYVVLSGK